MSKKYVSRLLFAPLCCALLILLATIFIPKSEAIAGGKPIPPAVWGVKILDYGNLLGMGDGYLYKDGEPFIRVTVQKGTTGGTVTRSTIHFFIYASDPVQKWAKFQGLSLTEYNTGLPGPAGACGFPDGYNYGVLPDCFLNFFNSAHPKPGYEHLLFYFVFNADIEDPVAFPPGQTFSWTGGGASTIYLWNSFDPLFQLDLQPYESVTASLKNLCSEAPKGIWITRNDANTWDIRVEQQIYDFSQHYSWATTTTGKNGRPTTTVTSYQPLTGKGELSFMLQLIKNPS
jgi:hypothetical protein